MAKKGASEFTVSFQGISLTNAQRAKITSAINGAVVSSLASLDLKGRPLAFIPMKWPGGLVGPIDQIRDLGLDGKIR